MGSVHFAHIMYPGLLGYLEQKSIYEHQYSPLTSRCLHTICLYRASRLRNCACLPHTWRELEKVTLRGLVQCGYKTFPYWMINSMVGKPSTHWVCFVGNHPEFCLPNPLTRISSVSTLVHFGIVSCTSLFSAMDDWVHSVCCLHATLPNMTC